MRYDHNNVFAKILRGDLPCKKILEDNFSLAFFDLCPKAKIHAIAIPKGHYTDAFDFHKKATKEEIYNFYTFINKTVETLLLQSFRILSNINSHSGQVVFHYHMHILGGEKLISQP